MGSFLSIVYDRKARIQTIKHLGREATDWLPSQPEPEIAAYFLSIIELVFDFICSVPQFFNSQLASQLLTA